MTVYECIHHFVASHASRRLRVYDRLRRGAVWRTNVEDWNSSLGAVLVYKTNGSGRGEGQGSLKEARAEHRRKGASLCTTKRGGNTVKTSGVVLGTHRLGQAERQLPRVHRSGVSKQFLFFYEYRVTCSQWCRQVAVRFNRRIRTGHSLGIQGKSHFLVDLALLNSLYGGLCIVASVFPPNWSCVLLSHRNDW